MTTNRLAQSSSAYLQSAAHQPIHWYPWGTEAFAAAQAADKPVLLDIGAVWCHWCHVMDGESYERSRARRLPEPELHLHQGGSGRASRCGRPLPARGADSDPAGWLAADGVSHPEGRGLLRRHLFPARRQDTAARAFGQYSPACSTHTAPGAIRCRPRPRRSAASWKKTSTRCAAGDLAPSCWMRPWIRWPGSSTPSTAGSAASPSSPTPVRSRCCCTAGTTSPRNRSAPSSTALCREWPEAACTISSAGGFHRYSVDARWIVPHFEKMSYDNSELLKAYLDAYALFGNDGVRRGGPRNRRGGSAR